MPQSHNGDSNTAEKLAKKRKNLTGRKFSPGFDPRRNLNGRPRSFDYARELAQSIAEEELELKDGRKITVAEAVLRQWAKSPEPTLQKAFVEYAFGKVPDKLEATGLEQKPVLILHYAHERQNAEQN